MSGAPRSPRVFVNGSRRHGRQCALLFIDVDHLNHYNETHGYLGGDELLRSVAQLLQERCRSSTLAARYGGERFAILCPNAWLRRHAAERVAAVQAHLEPGAYESGFWMQVVEV